MLRKLRLNGCHGNSDKYATHLVTLKKNKLFTFLHEKDEY